MKNDWAKGIEEDDLADRLEEMLKVYELLIGRHSPQSLSDRLVAMGTQTKLIGLGKGIKDKNLI